jgi:adhesin transport system membrane fusion protein
VISNPEGGIVDAILVRTGQQVNQGQELMRLDQTRTTSEFGSGEASVNALMAKIARLQAEVEGARAPLSAGLGPGHRQPESPSSARSTARAWPSWPA